MLPVSPYVAVSRGCTYELAVAFGQAMGLTESGPGMSSDCDVYMTCIRRNGDSCNCCLGAGNEGIEG